MGWMAGVRFLAGSRPALWSTQPPFQRVPEALFLGLKRPGHESDNSSPSSTEVKNGEAISPLPHMSSWHSA
jgi:hypothetical protein